MDYMMLEPYKNEFKGFVSDNKVMDELGLTKSQFDALVMYQRLYKGCVLIEDEADEKKASDTEKYESIAQCARNTGYTPTAISIMLRGIVKNSLGVRYAEV